MTQALQIQIWSDVLLSSQLLSEVNRAALLLSALVTASIYGVLRSNLRPVTSPCAALDETDSNFDATDL